METFRTSAKFVKSSDYFNYFGKDLAVELDVNQNESNKCDIFLMNVEDDLLNRIDRITFRLYKWDELTEHQIHCLQKAILKQAAYVIRNSDLFSDSGYDPEKGRIISRAEIETIQLSSATIDALMSGGLYNHVIRNRKRYTRVL